MAIEKKGAFNDSMGQQHFCGSAFDSLRFSARISYSDTVRYLSLEPARLLWMEKNLECLDGDKKKEEWSVEV